MEVRYDLMDIVRKTINDELERYADIIQEELSKKYAAEFEKLLRDYRRKIILDIAENIKFQSEYNPMDLKTNITIKM